ncbi:MAG: phage major capsid protein [Candidatus Peribacteria bacterium]|jgi:HK97 family phage major capsid protein|nr:phage major capsid protein [Candidatus Peribacteria bacterium]
MDTEALMNALTKALEKELPEAVKAVVDENLKEINVKVKEFEEANKNLEEEVKTLNKKIVFGNNEDEAAKNLAIKTVADYVRGLRKGNVSEEVKAAYMNEGTDADGGVFVPTELAREVLRVASTYGVAREYCHIIPMGTDTKDVTRVIDGVTAYWTAEGAAYTKSKPNADKISLVAKKVTVLVGSTNELIEDNMTDFEIWTTIAQIAGEQIAKFEDTQVFEGNGTAPNFLGVFKSLSGANSINIVAMNTPGKVTYDDIIDLEGAVEDKYLKQGKGGIFLLNKSYLTQVRKLKDDNGNPIYQELGEGLKRMLLGYPVITTDVMPSVASAVDGDVVIGFGNLYHYIIGDRKQLSSAFGYCSGDWEKDIQSLKMNERIAGALAFGKAFSGLIKSTPKE